MEHHLQPEGYYIYLREKPAFETPFVKELPAGVYLCFRGRLLADDWDISIVKALMKNQPVPELVIADEYEDNLKKFTQCMYEIQFLIEKEPV